MSARSPADDDARRVAASAWRFRWQVEREAAVRFQRLAEGLASIGGAPELVALARRSGQDERRHAGLCAELAEELGAPVREEGPAVARPLAPSGLLPRGQVLYELVAACCITETESMAVLTTLLPAARGPRLRRVLRQLAGDEVRHGRLGWAHLATEHAAGTTAFLGPLVPAMLEGSVTPDLFRPAAAGPGDGALLALGVLPPALKHQVFTRTLDDVVFPGLDRFGVDTAPARAWLAAKEARGP